MNVEDDSNTESANTSRGFVKMWRGPLLAGLMQGRKGSRGETHHNDLVVAMMIALRARRDDGGYNPDGLRPGEARMGDWHELGLTRKQGTVSLARLKAAGVADFRTIPSVGTVAWLTNPSAFDPLSVFGSGASTKSRGTSVNTGLETDDASNGARSQKPSGDSKKTAGTPVNTGLEGDLFENGDSKGTARGQQGDSKKKGKKGKKGKKEEPPYPPGEFSERLHKLWRRRKTTKWDAKEKTAFKALSPIDSEDFDLIERFYSAEEDPKSPLYRRQSLLTLLNNWAGEIDRARRWAKAANGSAAITNDINDWHS